jgi:hypothetical protein
VRAVPRAVGITLLAALVASPVLASSLRDQFSQAARLVGLEGGGAFDALGDAIADTAARNLPVISASAGFTYKYNPQLEVFERTSQTLGPLFLERPDTLGQGKINVSVNYQYVELNHLDGTPTTHLQSPDPIVVRVTDVTGATQGFTANSLRYSFRLIDHIAGFSFTYGVLDDLDVNIFLPVISTVFRVSATSQQLFVAGTDKVFAPAPLPANFGELTDEKVGVGDILLRGKYRFSLIDDWNSAAGLVLRLPSGDKDNFQGTGTFEASPFYYGSTVLWGRVEPYVNAGFDLRADDVSRSDFRFGIGVDGDVTQRIGLSLAFLDRNQFNGSASPADTEFLHLTSSGPALRPLLDVDFGRKDFFDLSFGVRAVVWRQVMLIANGIYALNDQGLRNNSVIPMIGVEGTF